MLYQHQSLYNKTLVRITPLVATDNYSGGGYTYQNYSVNPIEFLVHNDNILYRSSNYFGAEKTQEIGFKYLNHDFYKFLKDCKSRPVTLYPKSVSTSFSDYVIFKMELFYNIGRYDDSDYKMALNIRSIAKSPDADTIVNTVLKEVKIETNFESMEETIEYIKFITIEQI